MPPPNNPHFITKACTKCSVVNDRSGFFKSKRNIDGHQGACKVCMTRSAKKWAIANSVRMNAHHAKYIKAHPEKNAAKSRRWRKKYPEKHYAKNEEYRKRYPAKHNAKTRKAYASKVRAIPKWANLFFIEEIYDLAARRTKATGCKWHVDHIVPLQSQIVCGLHVHNNLRVIPALENHKKGNRHWPDMP